MDEIGLERVILPKEFQVSYWNMMIENLKDNPTIENYERIKSELDSKKRFFGRHLDQFYTRLEIIRIDKGIVKSADCNIK